MSADVVRGAPNALNKGTEGKGKWTEGEDRRGWSVKMEKERRGGSR